MKRARNFIILGASVIAVVAMAQVSIDQGGRRINGNLTVVGTTTLTGAQTLTGATTLGRLTVTSDAGVGTNFSVGSTASIGRVDAGDGFIANNLGVGGVAYAATSKPDLLDAGRAYFNGPVGILEGLSVGHCTLVDGTNLSSCTDTVSNASVLCTCSPVGATAAIAAGGCAVGVSGTTLTITGPDNGNYEVNWHCF